MASSAIFIMSLGLTLVLASRTMAFLEESQIEIPTISDAGFPVLYFFGVIAIVGAALFFIPVRSLKVVLRVLFGLAFVWGTFTPLALLMPVLIAGFLSLVIAVTWLFVPRIWLHNALLCLTLVSLAAVFGAILTPWTVLTVMLIISVYDLVAVRLGYMQWMTRKLSDSDTMPAFIVPRRAGDWGATLKGPVVKTLFEETTGKDFSVLGGGDIFFPLLLASSVLYAFGLQLALMIAGFSLIGLMAAYGIHIYLMKGKATAALPPVFIASLCGLLLVQFVLLA